MSIDTQKLEISEKNIPLDRFNKKAENFIAACEKILKESTNNPNAVSNFIRDLRSLLLQQEKEVSLNHFYTKIVSSVRKIFTKFATKIVDKEQINGVMENRPPWVNAFNEGFSDFIGTIGKNEEIAPDAEATAVSEGNENKGGKEGAIMQGIAALATATLEVTFPDRKEGKKEEKAEIEAKKQSEKAKPHGPPRELEMTPGQRRASIAQRASLTLGIPMDSGLRVASNDGLKRRKLTARERELKKREAQLALKNARTMKEGNPSISTSLPYQAFFKNLREKESIVALGYSHGKYIDRLKLLIEKKAAIKHNITLPDRLPEKYQHDYPTLAGMTVSVSPPNEIPDDVQKREVKSSEVMVYVPKKNLYVVCPTAFIIDLEEGEDEKSAA